MELIDLAGEMAADSNHRVSQAVGAVASPALLNLVKILEDEGAAQHLFPQCPLAAVSWIHKHCCSAVAGISEAVLSPLSACIWEQFGFCLFLNTGCSGTDAGG